jgi:tripartite-type tricarboxylate transporter receptor subunit TctC
VRTFTYCAAAVLFTLTAAGSLHAQSVADFYAGKTVTVVAPSGTGGSIYKYALLVSNHLGRHIPGNPTTVAESRGGGGGVKAANYVANAAPKDGTIVAELHPSSLIVPMIRDVEYDPRNFYWLGSVAVRTYVGAVWHTVEADTLEKMRDTPTVFGGSGTGSPSYMIPTFLAHVSGAQLKVVPGYKSGGDTNLAMERGEVQGRGNFYEGFLATNPDWIADKKVKFVFKAGPDHPDLADVAPASKYVKTPEEKQMLGLLEAPLNLGQSFYVVGDVPDDRKAALRKAFEDMLKDPEFLAEAEKLNLYINPLGYAAVTSVVEEVYKTPKDVVDGLGKILENK